jgi:hypothetical protein
VNGLLNFFSGLSLALLILVLISVRRAHIRVEYSVVWLGAALALLVLSRYHWLLERMAAALGTPDAPLALMLVTGCLFLLVLFRVSIVVSELKDANIALAQRVAILEFRLRSLDEKAQTPG